MRREGVQSAKRALAHADSQLRQLQGRMDRIWSVLAAHDNAARQAVQDGGGKVLALHTRCAEELRGVMSKQHSRLADAQSALRRRRQELADASAQLEVLRRLEEKQADRRRKKALAAETRQNDAGHAARRRRGTVAISMAEQK